MGAKKENAKELIIENEAIIEKNFLESSDNELLEMLNKEKIFEKTVNNSFSLWKKDFKANIALKYSLKSEKSIRNKIRNMQISLSKTVNVEDKANELQNCKLLYSFYRIALNDFKRYSNKNNDTGKDIDTIKKAYEKMIRILEIKS